MLDRLPWLAVLLVAVSCAPALAADKRYPVSEIPEDLRKNVNVVIRKDEMEYTIESRRKATLRRSCVVTILNPKGRSYARMTLGYDPLTRISAFSATIFDEEGNQVRKLKPGEIEDYAAQDGFSLYSDDRLKSANMVHTSYPYTVEFIYTVDYRYLYSIPGMAIAHENVSVQSATYQLVFPSDLAPRYRLMNWAAEPARNKRDAKMESLTWMFENVKPIVTEPHGRPEGTPRIMAAPTLFEYDGFAGDMSSWESYGKWNAQLRNGRDVLPENAKAKVRELTSNLSTNEQKVRALYEHLQQKTRYVNITEGIGGLQPFAASVVEQNGYGDCKALSNYMIAMLKEAGITGLYSRIRAGEDEPDLIRDFPSHQTNHIIVAVPNGKDTLWLECTSQTQPFGYLGRFTGDRLALLITESGGQLVRTPGYPADQNRQFRTVELEIDIAGNGKASIRTHYTGTQTENGGLLGVANGKSEDQKKWIQKNTDIPNFDINSFSIQGRKDKLPSVTVRAQLLLNRYASVSGKRVFVVPNLMNRSTYIPEKVEERKTDVFLDFAYTDVDSVIISMPEALYPEFVPQTMKASSRFGEYEASFSFENGRVTYIRKMMMRKGTFPKESYPELIDFYKNVNKYDNLKLVLLNRT